MAAAAAAGGSLPKISAFPNLRNRIFIMRHGQSEANAAGLIVCDPVDGCTGYGLTDMGRSQVQETCINLQSLLQSSPSSSPASDPTIVSSDFKRTSETAEIVRKHFQIESHVRYERTLRERNFGDFNLTSQTNYQKVWDVDSRNTHHTKYGCESVTSVVSRVSQLVRRLDEESEGKIILLVSHGDTLQILTTLFLGIAPGLHKTLPDIPQAGLRELTGDLNSYKPHRFTQ